MTPQEIILGFIPVFAPLITGGIKRLITKTPKAALPIIAGAAGPAIDLLASTITDSPAQPLLAAALGFAGVGLREVNDQISKARKARRDPAFSYRRR